MRELSSYVLNNTSMGLLFQNCSSVDITKGIVIKSNHLKIRLLSPIWSEGLTAWLDFFLLKSIIHLIDRFISVLTFNCLYFLVICGINVCWNKDASWTGTEPIHESRCRETLRKPQFGSNPTGPEEKAKPGNPWVEAAGSTKASGWFWSEIEMMTLLFLFFFFGHNKRFPTAF